MRTKGRVFSAALGCSLFATLASGASVTYEVEGLGSSAFGTVLSNAHYSGVPFGSSLGAPRFVMQGFAASEMELALYFREGRLSTQFAPALSGAIEGHASQDLSVTSILLAPSEVPDVRLGPSVSASATLSLFLGSIAPTGLQAVGNGADANPPVPPAVWLLLSGIAGVVAFARRRKDDVVGGVPA